MPVENTNGTYPPVQATAEPIEVYEAPPGTLLARSKRGRLEQRTLYFRAFLAHLEAGPMRRGVTLERDGRLFALSQADLEILLQQLREM